MWEMLIPIAVAVISVIGNYLQGKTKKRYVETVDTIVKVVGGLKDPDVAKTVAKGVKAATQAAGVKSDAGKIISEAVSRLAVNVLDSRKK
jgi:hypothetical protein